MAKRPSAAQIPPHRQVTLNAYDPVTWFAVWPVRRIRFFMSDGATIDVLTPHDDSDLRAAILQLDEVAEGVGILSATTINEPEPSPGDGTEAVPDG